MAQDRTSTRELTAGSLLAALLAAVSIVVLPIGPVPITLQVFVVVLIALLLRPAWALTATGVYVLVGAIGVPVFAGLTGGLGILFGPTGGYLFGFVFGSAIGSAVRRAAERRMVPRVVSDSMGALATVAVIYILGVTQLWGVSNLGQQGLSLMAAVAVGAAPFIVPDLIKAAVAIVVAEALRRTGVVPDPAPSRTGDR